ncbi:hypothetical protein HanIR_Chr10g0454561 [Helianthus annuus]|nr:hypothetical protein HanIR_Chr10g0454561 [Helianthus annuus]
MLFLKKMSDMGKLIGEDGWYSDDWKMAHNEGGMVMIELKVIELLRVNGGWWCAIACINGGHWTPCSTINTGDEWSEKMTGVDGSCYGGC